MSTVADVPRILKKVSAAIATLSPQEKGKMKKAMDRLKDSKFISSVHYVANLLEPKYKGKHLSDVEKTMALKALDEYANLLRYDDAERRACGLSLGEQSSCHCFI